VCRRTEKALHRKTEKAAEILEELEVPYLEEKHQPHHLEEKHRPHHLEEKHRPHHLEEKHRPHHLEMEIQPPHHLEKQLPQHLRLTEVTRLNREIQHSLLSIMLLLKHFRALLIIPMCCGKPHKIHY
jgi:hypothetical protein